MNSLSEQKTHELVDELIKREGVKEIVINPCEKIEIKKADPIEGPARVLVIID